MECYYGVDQFKIWAPVFFKICAFQGSPIANITDEGTISNVYNHDYIVLGSCIWLQLCIGY